MKILHTADLHLAEGHDERWKALADIVALGEKESIDSLVVSGDLFDTDTDSLKYKAKLRELLKNISFDIYIIPGNHDIRSFEDRAFFGSRVKVIRSFGDKFEKDGIVITGLPFRNIKEQEIFPARLS